MLLLKTKTFNELTNTEVYELLKLRAQVFVVEQNCVYQDADDRDIQSFHVMGYHGNELAAYCRLVPAGLAYSLPSIGRVVTNPTFRKMGYAKCLMKYSITETLHQFNTKEIIISAQQYLELFYTQLGFKKESDMYLEDNIPHIKMRYS